ncbi:MAG: STAS domain-containing protein [Actinoallomurus sp.]|jgi:anti-sigma B factor antagonist
MSVGEVVVERDQGVWVLNLHGEHDLTTAPSLRSELERVFAAGSAVVVDLSEAEFLDSTIVAALAYGRDRTAEHDAHSLAVVVARDGVARRLLTVTGLDTKLATFETREAAIASLSDSD